MGILALAADERVAGAELTNDALSVALMDGRVITVPLAWYPRLLDATQAERNNWQISGGGYGIHWPDIDEDLSTEGLLRGAPAPGIRLSVAREQLATKAPKPDAEAYLDDPEFQTHLDTVCRTVFAKFGPLPRYSEWQDLRQEVIIKLSPWLREYKGKATLKTVLGKIAANLCIDEIRRQEARSRAHVEIDFEELNSEALSMPSADDPDARILFAECRSQLSGLERIVFDEYYTEGRTLLEIAHRHQFSPQTAMNKMFSILEKLKRFVAGQDDSKIDQKNSATGPDDSVTSHNSEFMAQMLSAMQGQFEHDVSRVISL